MPSDYKKLNLIALGGTLVYAGYLLGSIKQDDSVAAAVNSAFTNSDSEDRPGRLRAASPSASWDTRLTNSASWDIGASEEDEDDFLVLPSVHVEKNPNFANGPVINNIGEKASTINLIGERHSGTNWITDHLIDCFGDQIQVSSSLIQAIAAIKLYLRDSISQALS